MGAAGIYFGGVLAIVENFIVDVKTPGILNMTGASVFGGIVGSIANSTATMKDITVKGKLEYANCPGGSMLMAGGLVGQVSGTAANVTITRCVSLLEMTLGSVPGGSMGIACGTMTGRIFSGGTVTITKSYATGNISMINGTLTARDLYSGMVPHIYGGNLTIEECYNSGNMYVEGVNVMGFAGSILGNTYSNAGSASVSRCAALSESAIVALSVDTRSGTGRIFGRAAASGPTPTFSNNFARINMLTGTDPTAAPVDVIGDANTAEGLGKSLNELKMSSTWTDLAPYGLGWDPADWDFSGLTQIGDDFYWPRLK
jgi:hypothetical protein